MNHNGYHIFFFIETQKNLVVIEIEMVLLMNLKIDNKSLEYYLGFVASLIKDTQICLTSSSHEVGLE